MGITTHGGTMTGGVTPTCDECGVSLCWDVSRTDYLEAKAFWDAWRCRDCAPSPLSAYGWKLENGREALAPEIEAVVVAFDDAHPELCVPGAANDPQYVCDGFVAALCAAGIPSSVVIAGDVRGKPHRAVAVGDFTIDWTAVRHDEDAPVPLVYRTALGWPIVPQTVSQLLDSLNDMDLEAFEALLTKAIASRADRSPETVSERTDDVRNTGKN